MTTGLPVRESAGPAMNALAHCAEALYTADRSAETYAEAASGRDAGLALAASGGRQRTRR